MSISYLFALQLLQEDEMESLLLKMSIYYNISPFEAKKMSVLEILRYIAVQIDNKISQFND